MTQSQRNGEVQKGAEGRGRTKGVKAETCHLFSLVDFWGKRDLPSRGASEGRTQRAFWVVGWL